MEAIEAKQSDLKIGNSLSYINGDQSTEEVFAYFDSSEMVMLEEEFYNGKTGNQGVRLFYFEKGKLIASYTSYYDKTVGEGIFKQIRTFYNPQQEPIYTEMRVADYEEDLETNEFLSAKPMAISHLNALRVLNQEGPYATTFQGFFQNGPEEYLIVGGPKKQDYTSSMLVTFSDETIKFLRKNEERMIGTPLRVNFEKMVDGSDYSFQVLTKVEMLTY